MNMKHSFAPEPQRIVYIRPVAMDSLPAELRAQAPELETIYAVHDSDGERLALVADRRLAFMLAREHELTALSVH